MNNARIPAMLFAHNATPYSDLALAVLNARNDLFVATCNNARSALHCIDSNKENGPDIIIVTNQLHHGDELSPDVTNNRQRTGEAIYARVRMIPGHESTPVIIVTMRSEEIHHLENLNDPNLTAILADTFAIDTAITGTIQRFFPNWGEPLIPCEEVVLDTAT
jgi:hypothetical protein